MIITKKFIWNYGWSVEGHQNRTIPHPGGAMISHYVVDRGIFAGFSIQHAIGAEKFRGGFDLGRKPVRHMVQEGYNVARNVFYGKSDDMADLFEAVRVLVNDEIIPIEKLSSGDVLTVEADTTKLTAKITFEKKNGTIVKEATKDCR